MKYILFLLGLITPINSMMDKDLFKDGKICLESIKNISSEEEIKETEERIDLGEVRVSSKMVNLLLEDPKYTDLDRDMIPKAVKSMKKSNPDKYRRLQKKIFEHAAYNTGLNVEESQGYSRRKAQRLESELTILAKEQSQIRIMQAQDALKKERYKFYVTLILGLLSTLSAILAPIFGK